MIGKFVPGTTLPIIYAPPKCDNIIGANMIGIFLPGTTNLFMIHIFQLYTFLKAIIVPTTLSKNFTIK